MEKVVKVITLCSGYDSQLLALKRLSRFAKTKGDDIKVECVAWCEFDPEAIRKAKENEEGAFYIEPEIILDENGEAEIDDKGNPCMSEGGWFKYKPLDEQPAVIAHKLLHPDSAERNLGDMAKVDWLKFKAEYFAGTKLSNEEFAKKYLIGSYEEYLEEGDKNLNEQGKELLLQQADIELLTYSTPCFVAGTQVLTRDGFKSIEALVEGEEVITHSKTFEKITECMKREYFGTLYKLRGMCFDEIICTPEHPFYVRERYRKGHEGVRTFREPVWVAAKSLTKNHYLGLPINTDSKLPEWKGVELNQWGHHRVVDTLTEKFSNPSFWYLMGRYVGDGWQRKDDAHRAVIICCSNRNEQSLVDCLDSLGFHYVKAEERTVTKLTIYSKELQTFVQRYGYKANGKVIDDETLSLPKELLKSFIQGYCDSDGYVVDKYKKITTTSRVMVYGLVQCIAKVYNRAAQVSVTKRPETTVIEGRTVHQNISYTVIWKEYDDVQDKAFCEDGYIWFPLREIEVLQDQETQVYNIEVEGRHSYTANGCIVHNCTDISSAGLQKGFDPNSNTRSSVLWDTLKCIQVIKPKYLMQENVSAIVSKKFLPMFNAWQLAVEKMGYRNYTQLMNAKDYGVPQNRLRLFMLSVRDDLSLNFRFPQPYPLERKLADVLEKNVDERYYVAQEKTDEWIENERERLESSGLI